MEHMSLRDVRDKLGQRVDVAHFKDEPTVITKNGEPRAVLVSHHWYEEAMRRVDDQHA